MNWRGRILENAVETLNWRPCRCCDSTATVVGGHPKTVGVAEGIIPEVRGYARELDRDAVCASWHDDTEHLGPAGARIDAISAVHASSWRRVRIGAPLQFPASGRGPHGPIRHATGTVSSRGHTLIGQSANCRCVPSAVGPPTAAPVRCSYRRLRGDEIRASDVSSGPSP